MLEKPLVRKPMHLPTVLAFGDANLHSHGPLTLRKPRALRLLSLALVFVLAASCFAGVPSAAHGDETPATATGVPAEGTIGVPAKSVIGVPTAKSVTAIEPLSSDSTGLATLAVNLTTNLTGTEKYGYATEVVSSVNVARAANGKAALTVDKDLTAAAMQRVAEIAVFFNHTRPSGKSCFTVSDKVYGENIAAGYSTSANVMTGWMNSDGHRENILRNTFVSIGVGCFVHEGTTYWVQLFGIEEATAGEALADKTVAHTIKISTNTCVFKNASIKAPKSVSSTKSPTVSLRVENAGWKYAYFKPSATSVTWTSSNKGVLAVSANGKLTAKNNGSAKITGKFGDAKAKSGSIAVSCDPTPPTITGVARITVIEGYKAFSQKYTIKGTPKPTITLPKNPNSSKISIGKSGKLSVKKGLKAGTYKITIKTTNKTGSKTKSIKIIVKPKGSPTISGKSSLTLNEGYAKTTKKYTVKGSPKPKVTLSGNTADGKISLKNGKLVVKEGLGKGTYKVTIKAKNSKATATKKITIKIV
ncbi:MAG: CAP domain-containing protein [Coriobacteriia bacterium]|nr:CAP domain-containing protein [Coriobacteriia bacterium]